MLPPIRALPKLSSEAPGLPPTPLLRQRMDLGATDAEPAASTPPSIRIEIGLLSARLRLQYSFAMFAEAAGQFARLARREGEALTDFAQRVVETLKAMPPQERVETERLLNQMFKGVSLRLLTEILSDASGAKAARLALQLEAIPVDRDQAARAVVSSYRQNEGGEIKGRTNPPSPPEKIVQPDLKTPAPGRPTDIAARPETRAASTAMPQAPAMVDPDEASATPVKREAGNPVGHARTPLPAKAAAETAVREPIRSASAAGETASPATRSPVKEPPARKAGLQAALQPRHFGRVQGGKFAIAALTQWLAQALADESGRLSSPYQGPAARRALPEQVALRELYGEASPETDAPSMTVRNPTQPPGAFSSRQEPEAPASSAAARMAGAGSGPDRLSPPPAEPLERGASAMPLPPILRDGLTPPAFVPYPAQEPERDPERRRTRAVSETDEDGERPQSGGQDARGNDGGSDEDGENEGETPRRDGEESEGRPDELYWRMAGWN